MKLDIRAFKKWSRSYAHERADILKSVGIKNEYEIKLYSLEKYCALPERIQTLIQTTL